MVKRQQFAHVEPRRTAILLFLLLNLLEYFDDKFSVRGRWTMKLKAHAEVTGRWQG